MLHLLVKGSSKVKSDVLRFEVGNRGVSFSIIKASNLGKPTSNKVDFMVDEMSRSVTFESENKATVDDVATLGYIGVRIEHIDPVVVDGTKFVIVSHSPGQYIR